ncbi:MAG: hypothetical protein ACPGSG_08285 [Prolixibacteraceae bacterium]
MGEAQDKWYNKHRNDPEFIKKRKEYDKKRWLKIREKELEKRKTPEFKEKRSEWYHNRIKSPEYVEKKRKYSRNRAKERYNSDEEYKQKQIELSQKYRTNNKSLIKDKSKRFRMNIILEYGGKCNCCGESKYEFLTLDHVNNDGNVRRRKEHNGRNLFKYIINNDFPNDIQVLCYNCNMGKAHHGGICPHKKEKGL